MSEPVRFENVVAALHRASVRFVVIGVAGVNYWARSGHTVFTTKDFDVFLPPDPVNELAAWHACEAAGLELWSGDEILDEPREHFLASRIVEQRSLVRATDGKGLDVDLTLVMAGYDFEAVWSERRSFVVADVSIPVARLAHIVTSKAAAGREKDRLFLATHAEALRALTRREDADG